MRMNETSSRLHGLDTLEGVVMEQARIALELRNPRYGDVFRRTIHKGFDAAANAAQPFVQKAPPWWYKLLTGLLSVGLAMDEVNTALVLMRSHRAEGPGDGRLLDYHEHHWFLQTQALLEKSISLIKRVYRTLVKRLDPTSFKDRMDGTIEPLNGLRDALANVRNPIVHPVGGPITAVEEDRLWERYVLAGMNLPGVIDGIYSVFPQRRAARCAVHRELTRLVLRAIDVASAQAAKDATTMKAPP
jgi:hypothetical protein